MILVIKLSNRALLGDSMFYLKKYKVAYVAVLDLAILLATFQDNLKFYQIFIVLSAVISISISILLSKRKILY